MEFSDFLQWPILVGALVIFLAGYMIGAARARNERDLIGPPPMRGSPQPTPVSSNPPKLSGKLAEWADLDEETEFAINNALAQGKTIEAIKMLREATGKGLKESKEAIDRWR